MKSILKWLVGIFAGLVIIGFLFGVLPEQSETQKTAEREPVVSNDAPFETTASEIAKAYSDNTEAADKKYKNKAFVVSGSVVDINADNVGHTFLILAGDVNQSMEPHFILADSEKSKAVELKKGQKVKMQCFGKGDIANIAYSEDCELLFIDWN